jgi:predicted MFS family arabinose efflux permease
MVGLVVATFVAASIGWRVVFYITGSLGLLMALVIFFTVREPRRGGSEPELKGVEEIAVHKFDFRLIKDLLRKKTILLLFAQGFVGVFPWTVITFWFFRYLETERGFDDNAILTALVPTILVLAAGYFVGGVLGDYFYKRTRRGRLLVSMVSVLVGAILLVITMNVPLENQGLFSIMLMITALFIPFAAPNVVSTVHDISLPEVRSTALALQLLIENGGAAVAPFVAGLIAVSASLHSAILSLSVGAWIVGAVILAVAAYNVPADIEVLHQTLRQRALEAQSR